MLSNVTFTAAGFRAAFFGVLPLSVGLIPFGIVAGVTAQAHGLSMMEALLMSGLVFAGSAQLLALSGWTVPATAIAAGLTAGIMNLRFVLMGPLLAPWLDHVQGWRRWLSLFVMVDQNWATSLKEIERGTTDAAYLLGSGVLFWILWLISTAFGHGLGQLIAPEPGHPIFFAAIAVFITLLVPMWRGKRDFAPWIVAAVVAVATARAMPGKPWYIVTGAIAGAVAGAVRDRLQRAAT